MKCPLLSPKGKEGNTQLASSEDIVLKDNEIEGVKLKC